MINVLLHLGYGFLRATMTAPLRLGRGGRRFLEGYEPEGLRPASPITRELSSEFERCLGCGLCELTSPDGSPLPQLASTWWRSPECRGAYRSLVKDLDRTSLLLAEETCPAAVPLAQMVAELDAIFPMEEEIAKVSS